MVTRGNGDRNIFSVACTALITGEHNAKEHEDGENSGGRPVNSFFIKIFFTIGVKFCKDYCALMCLYPQNVKVAHLNARFLVL